MYRKVSVNLITPHNLKSVPLSRPLFTISNAHKLQLFGLPMFQQIKLKITTLIKDKNLLKILCNFSRFNPEKSLKVWLRQFEFVFAQRIRRGQQMMCMYSRLWEEKALQEFLRRLRISISRNGKELMLGAVGLSAYNWDENKIKDEEFDSHLEDVDYIEVLKDETICEPCDDNKSAKKSVLCRCGMKGNTKKTYDNWDPFIIKDDLIVWRRPHGDGFFEYKVYGSYSDVSAEDFLNVQIDTEYRKEWDTTAVQLHIGEKDLESNSDILYWEMLWPRLFVNRDYVFNRRYKVDSANNLIMIINKTTEYPAFPKYPDKYRVEEYWSCMVIKPYTEMSKPGIKFSLTYFDNPGVNIPSTVTTWVAKSVMPDYLTKLRYASKNYRGYCLTRGTSKACDIIRAEEKRKKEQEEKERLDYCANERGDLERIVGELKRLANDKLNRKRSAAQVVVATTETQASVIPQNKPKSWKYFYPFYYFT